jgi:hypothetical protein
MAQFAKLSELRKVMRERFVVTSSAMPACRQMKKLSHSTLQLK